MTQTDLYYVPSPNLLALKANVPQVKWSYGVDIPPASVAEYESCLLHMELMVHPRVNTPEPTAMGKYHYYFAHPNEDCIFYERDFFLGRKLKLQVSGLLNGTPKVIANRDYFRFIQHRFMNLHSIGYILTDIVGWFLLRHDYTPIHCSAFVYRGETVVVFAPPNTGKTLSTMMMCLEHDAHFIAEDIAITDGKSIYAVPWTTTFRYYSQVEEGLWSRAVNKMTRVLPVLELFPLAGLKNITKYVSESHIVNRSTVDRVVILERAEPGVQSLQVADAVRRISNLNRYEFNYRKSPTMVAYEYFNPDVDLASACEAEQRILLSLVENAHCSHLVTAINPSDYSGLIRHLLSQ
ncbi:MAG: hypothetical protein JXA33_26185 [Anaerolineae bacterium]|nr:hypothetical protein [Anaerolineae bacterium]